MKKYNGRFIITIVLIVSLLTGCGKTIDIPVLLEPVEMKYEGRKVTQKDIYDIEVYQGVVTPGMESIYFEEESVLKQVYTSIGKEMKRGEVIAVRDDRELYTQYEDLNAEIQYLEQLYSLQNRLAEIENELAMMDAKDLQNSVVAMQ